MRSGPYGKENTGGRIEKRRNHIMSNSRSLVRITLLFISLITNSGAEPGNSDGVLDLNYALATAPTQSVDNIISSNRGMMQIKNFHGGLNLASVESTGVISMTWTSPGDDADSGCADHYVIRFSNDPISDANWDQAFEALNPPAPLDAGSPQEYTLTGLERGRRYYFAIKAFDESGNISPISNIANAFASGIMPPTLVGADIDSANRSANLYANPVEAAMPIFYEFALDSMPTFPNPLIDVDLLVDSLVSVTFTELSDNVIYFWRCRAVAVGRSDSSSWSVIDSFLIYMSDFIAPAVNVSSPNGGETLEVGSTYMTRWVCSDNVGVNSCRVEYSYDSGSNWVLLQDWVSIPDSFSWTVPSQLSTQCLVRVSARDAAGNVGSDLSDGLFTVGDNIPPTVFINDPVVDDSITMGWNAFDNGIIMHYLIDYTTNGGQNWTPVASGPGGDSGSVTMPIPDQIPALGIRVTCFDMAENAGADTFIVTPTSADNGDVPIPAEYYLGQSYPNPFNPSATIEYGLPVSSRVTIEIFDITGSRVAALKDEYEEAGNHKIIWNAGNVTSGTYFYRIVAGEFSEVGKATLVK
jgi:hypothetical protein